MSVANLVSVVIPAYNAAWCLWDAIRSVQAQSWRNWELVVVNDGSQDSTGDVAEEHARNDSRVRVVHQTNRGLSAARNRGIEASRGTFIALLDADDALLPSKLANQVAFLEHFQLCDLVFSDHYVGDSELRPGYLECKLPPRGGIVEALTYRNWFAPFSPLYRRTLAEKVGPFCEELRASEDWDYWIRASRVGALAYLPGPVGVYRTHPNQMHGDRGRMQKAWAQVIERNFPEGSPERRRARTSVALWEWHWCWQQRRWLASIAGGLRFVATGRTRRILRDAIRLNAQ